jgi:histidinol phosphatase-like PHP family hydrolase
MIPSDEIERVFTKAAERGCGIELNGADMCIAGNDAEAYLRPFHIAKSCGCKFYLGSDAHTTKECNRYFEGFERSIDLLGLEEKDKFHIGT